MYLRLAGAAVAVATLVIACSTTQPLPSAELAPPSEPGHLSGTAEPTRSNMPMATPTVPPSTTPSNALTHFAANGYSFDYPAAWEILAEQHSTHGPYWTIAVVGTGEWDDGCEETASSLECGATHITVEPGQVVAELTYMFSGPADPAYGVPPFDAERTPSGLAVVFTDRDAATTATVYVPGHRPITVEIRWGLSPSPDERATAHAIAASIAVANPNSSVVELQVWERADEPRRCDRESLEGQLATGDFGVGTLAVSSGFAFVRWPRGWTAHTRTDGRFEVRDQFDAVVATEWDQVRIGGRQRDGRMYVCADAVAVLREFTDR